MKTCKHCGSNKVFYDAWVSANDPSHVMTFDYTFCMDCDDQCKIVEVSDEQIVSNPKG
jgi:hypothetical protein